MSISGDGSVRVAVVQAAPIAFETAPTLDRVADLCGRAAADGARLVVFPEAFVGGYPRGLDFGARVGGYCADMTRTVVIGSASERHREIYESVLAANEAGAAAVRAGALGCDIDGAARAVIVERGFGEYFGHGLGHGVGLEVHELPGLGPRSKAPVPLGSVITIEPGIYVPGMGGVRIEDLVVVEEGGARVLTHSTKELLEV